MTIVLKWALLKLFEEKSFWMTTRDLAPAMGYVGDENVVYSLGCMGCGVSLRHLNLQDRFTD